MARKCKCVCRRKSTKRTTRTTKTKKARVSKKPNPQFKMTSQLYKNGKKYKKPFVNFARKSFQNRTAAKKFNDRDNNAWNKKQIFDKPGRIIRAKTAKVTKFKQIKKGY